MYRTMVLMRGDIRTYSYNGTIILLFHNEGNMKYQFTALACFLLTSLAAHEVPANLLTVAEKSKFEATSKHAEVVELYKRFPEIEENEIYGPRARQYHAKAAFKMGSYQESIDILKPSLEDDRQIILCPALLATCEA